MLPYTKINPSQEDSRNDLSHYTVDGQTLWSRAYAYCSAALGKSPPLACDEGERFVQAAEETLPAYLSAADGGALSFEVYKQQVRR